MIEYFQGVKTGLGDPKELQGYYTYRSGERKTLKLKSVYLDNIGEYAFFWSSRSDMPLHDFMVEMVSKKLKPYGSPWIARKHEEIMDRKVPDLILNNAYFEVETGLNHSRDQLKARLKKFPNFTYVIVPNSQQKARYKASLPAFHGRLWTLKEFENKFSL